MDRGESFILRHDGHDYITSEDMVRTFLRHAERAVASGRPELVALRHTGGVDFLIVTDDTTYSTRPRRTADVNQ